MASTRFNRVLLKVGGESLIGDRPYGIDPKAAMRVAEQIKAIYVENVEIALVMGGGNPLIPDLFIHL